MYQPSYMPRLQPMSLGHSTSAPLQVSQRCRRSHPGTSVLAIKYKDGVMMAADTLGTVALVFLFFFFH